MKKIKNIDAEKSFIKFALSPISKAIIKKIINEIKKYFFHKIINYGGDN